MKICPFSRLWERFELRFRTMLAGFGDFGDLSEHFLVQKLD